MSLCFYRSDWILNQRGPSENIVASFTSRDSVRMLLIFVKRFAKTVHRTLFARSPLVPNR